MKLERLANYASLIPHVQQAVGACTVINGIGMLILHSLRHEPEAGQKMRNIKSDLRTIAKGILRAIPIIGTLFSIILLIKDKLHSETISSNGGYRQTLHIHIRQELLHENPLLILDFLGDYLDKNNSLPLNPYVRFVGEKGLDGGGLSRTFLCSVIQNSVALLCPNQELPTVKTAKDAQRMRTLGNLMHIAAVSNTPIGSTFPKKLYQALVVSQQFTMQDEDLRLIELNALMPIHEDSTKEEALFLSAIPVNQLSDSQLQKLANTLSTEDNLPTWWTELNLKPYTIPPIEILQQNASDLRNQVAKIFTEDEESLTENDNYLNPNAVKEFLLQKIKSEVKAILEIAKRIYPNNGKYNSNDNPLKILTAEDLQASIEGSDLTADKIIGSLVCSGEKADLLTEWILTWIKENEDNKRMLENLIYAVTGSINFKEDENRKVLTFHLTHDMPGIFSFSTCGKACSVSKTNLTNYAIDKLYNSVKSDVNNPHYKILEKAQKYYEQEEYSLLKPVDKENAIYEMFKKEIEEIKIIKDEDLYETFKENLENDIKNRKNSFNNL